MFSNVIIIWQVPAATTCIIIVILTVDIDTFHVQPCMYVDVMHLFTRHCLNMIQAAILIIN